MSAVATITMKVIGIRFWAPSADPGLSEAEGERGRARCGDDPARRHPGDEGPLAHRKRRAYGREPHREQAADEYENGDEQGPRLAERRHRGPANGSIIVAVPSARGCRASHRHRAPERRGMPSTPKSLREENQPPARRLDLQVVRWGFGSHFLLLR
jgi:hypothetical protein